MSLFDAAQKVLMKHPRLDMFDAAEMAYAALVKELEEAREKPEGVPPLVIDGCDSAIVGAGVDNHGQMIIVYDYEALYGHFVEQFQDLDEPGAAALEWISFNIIGAYMGAGTPLIMYPGDREVVDAAADEYCEEMEG